MSALIGGIIAGVGALISSIISATTSKKQSVELMREQQKLNQQSIDAQNVYNSPVSQMERLANAGLSPHLVYQGNVTGNQSDSAKVSGIAKQVPFDTGLTTAVQQFFNGRQLENETRSTTQNIAESKQRTALDAAKTLGIMLENRYNDRTMEDRIKQQSAILARQLADTNKTNAEINNLHIMANNLVEQTKKIAAETGLTLEKAKTEVINRELQSQRVQNLKKEYELTDAQIKLVFEKIANVKADTDYKGLAYRIQEALFNSDKAGQQWLADHPNIAIVVSLIEKILNLNPVSVSARL